MNVCKGRMNIMMNFNENNKEGMVIPISDIVLLPGVTSILKVSRLGEEQLRNLLKEDGENIALSLKQNFNKKELK